MREDWVEIELGKIAEFEKGKKPKNQQNNKNDKFCYPYIDIEAFEKGIIKSYTDGVDCKFCSDDDFLMVWDGSRSGMVGKGMHGAIGSTLMRINIPGIHNNYAFYFLKSKFLEINTRAKGTGTPHVDPDLLWNYSLPIPPLPEQRAIVAKIEELFSRLDRGVEALKKAREQLKIYRQAVLKWAFEGKLTEEWRKTHEVEPAEKLLQRIKEEKEKYYRQKLKEWEQAVKEWEANGRQGKKPQKPKKPKELPPLTEKELAELAKLPERWVWVKMGAIVNTIQYGLTQSAIQEPVGPKFLRITDIQNRQVDWDTVPYCNVNEEEKIKYILEEGDIVFARTGATVGKTYLLKCPFPESVYASYLIRVKLPRDISSNFVFNFFQSEFYWKQIRSEQVGTGQPNVNGTKLSELILPICSVFEQQKILQEIETRLSIADKVEQTIEESLQKTEALRQSILKKAFEGKLLNDQELEAVRNDPEWEPAEKLLEKIKAEKEKLKTQSKRSANRKKGNNK